MSKFLNNVNLNGNELLNGVLHNAGTAPSVNAKAGGIYFDTSVGVKRITYHDGSGWVAVQPYDADLATIAALTGSSGFLKTDGAGNWTVDTSVYLTSSTGVTSVNGATGAITNIAVTTTGLGQFASTTSSSLAGVISDETGSGYLVFNTSPSFVTSITTSSTSFDLVNTTATTVNFAGAATAVNIGNASGTVVIAGNLTVNGTTTTINSTTITVDDKNIVLAEGNTLDSGADGGGITLNGASDKTFVWIDSTDSWTSSEHLNLASGKAYYINGTSVLNSTTLGSGVTGSSLTSVGTIGTGVWQGTAVAVAYGGTGATDAATARSNLGATGKYAANVGDGTNTSYTITHSLSTRDVQVYVYEAGSPYQQVFPDIKNTTTSAVTLEFSTAPTSNQYRVVVVG